MGKTLDPSHRRRKLTIKGLNIISGHLNSSHGEFEEFDWTSTSSTSTGTNRTDPFSVSIASPELERLWEEAQTYPQDPNLLDLNGEPSQTEMGTHINDFDIEDINALLDDSPLNSELQFINIQTPQPTGQQHLQSQLSTNPTPSPPSYTIPSTEKAPNISCQTTSVMRWTVALENLSRASSSSPIALDELFHHSSVLLPRATEALSSLPSDPSSMTPFILILLCLTQTIVLFEQCIPTAISSLQSCGPQDISLRLGAFQVDREAQQALQRHIIGKELSRILNVCKLMQQALRQPSIASLPKRTHTVLLDDLHLRIKALASLVMKK